MTDLALKRGKVLAVSTLFKIWLSNLLIIREKVIGPHFSDLRMGQKKLMCMNESLLACRWQDLH